LVAPTTHAQFLTVAPETTVCRAGTCTSAGKIEPKLLFKQIHLMFKSNIGKTVTLCPDTGSDQCAGNGISVPVTVAGSGRLLTLTRAVLTDVSPTLNPPKVNLILAYDARLNSYLPDCRSSASQFDMTSPSHMQLVSDAFTCALTETTEATVSLTFDIDYINLAESVMSGTYTLSVTGAAVGSTSGRALMKLERKTPVTLDAKSIGIRQPDQAALLDQARAEVQAKHQQQIFDRIRAESPKQDEVIQMIAQNGGMPGSYTVPAETMAPMGGVYMDYAYGMPGVPDFPMYAMPVTPYAVDMQAYGMSQGMPAYAPAPAAAPTQSTDEPVSNGLMPFRVEQKEATYPVSVPVVAEEPAPQPVSPAQEMLQKVKKWIYFEE